MDVQSDTTLKISLKRITVMTFNLEQIKNLIYVANSFEEWANNGKKEPIVITEEIPMNLWNLFRIYLFRFCDRNTDLKLPPNKTIPADYLYGTFRTVEVSPATEYVSENAFRHADINNSKNYIIEMQLYDVDIEKVKLDFGKIKALSAFEKKKNITDFTAVMNECNKNENIKNCATVLSKEEFIQQSEKSELKLCERISEAINAPFSFRNSVLIFDTRIILKTARIRRISSFCCYAFLFETENKYLFVCVPFGIVSYIEKENLSTVPFILEKWMETLHKE